MEHLFGALANSLRIAILRELLRAPGKKHHEILSALKMPRGKGGTLTKAIDTLEEAGLVARDSSGFGVVDPERLSLLLITAADLEIAARRRLAERAQDAIPAAEKMAIELRRELGDEA
jgi:DNA-binding MarR family transcriptional regulator